MGPMAKVFSLKFGLECDRCQVEESGGNMFNVRKGYVYLIQKRRILIFSKMAHLKSKIF